MNDDLIMELLSELIPTTGGELLAQQFGFDGSSPIGGVISSIMSQIIPGTIQLDNAPSPHLERALQAQRPAAIASSIMRNEDFSQPFHAARENQVDDNMRSIITPMLPEINKALGTNYELDQSVNMMKELAGVLDTVVGTNILGSMTNISDPGVISANLAQSVRNSSLSHSDRVNAAEEISTAFSERVIRRDDEGNAVGENRAVTRGLTAEQFSEVINVGRNAGIINTDGPSGMIDQASALSEVVFAGQAAFGIEDIDTTLRLAQEINGKLDASSTREITEAFQNLSAILDTANMDGQDFLQHVDSIRAAGGPGLTTREAMRIGEESVARKLTQQDVSGTVDTRTIATATRTDTAIATSDFAVRATIAAALDLDPNDPNIQLNEQFITARRAIARDPSLLRDIERELTPEQLERRDSNIQQRASAELDRNFARETRQLLDGMDAEQVKDVRSRVGDLIDQNTRSIETIEEVVRGVDPTLSDERVQKIARNLNLIANTNREFFHNAEGPVITENVQRAIEDSRRDIELQQEMASENEESAKLEHMRRRIVRDHRGDAAKTRDSKLLDIAIVAEDAETREEALAQLSKTSGIPVRELSAIAEGMANDELTRDKATKNLGDLGLINEDGELEVPSQLFRAVEEESPDIKGPVNFRDRILRRRRKARGESVEDEEPKEESTSQPAATPPEGMRRQQHASITEDEEPKSEESGTPDTQPGSTLIEEIASKFLPSSESGGDRFLKDLEIIEDLAGDNSAIDSILATRDSIKTSEAGMESPAVEDTKEDAVKNNQPPQVANFNAQIELYLDGKKLRAELVNIEGTMA